MNVLIQLKRILLDDSLDPGQSALTEHRAT